MRLGAIVLAIILGAVLGAPAATADEPPATLPKPAQSAIETLGDRVRDLPTRLAGLHPDDARAYFELGEEVASEAASPDERRLARELHALAFQLARTTGPDDSKSRGLQASALLALAGLSETPGERRWLLALGQTLASRPAANTEDQSDASGSSAEPGALAAATAIDMARNGEGRRATKYLAKPGARELLLRSDRLLDPNGLTGGTDRLLRIMDQYPLCPECHNRRVIKDKDGVHLCTTCGGQPGPRLAPLEVLALVRTEAVLLSGDQLSWASQTFVDDGAPLRDLSLAEVAPTYGVDARRPLWRDGQWAEDPGAPSGPPAPPVAPDPKP